VRLRLGYAWAENPIRENPGQSAGGVSPPNGRPVIEYVQSTLAVVNEHRISAGVGICNVLPGIDFDLFAGGMFKNTDRFADTIASIESYWVGAGITWRFGRGASESLHVPNEW
jgi:long-chain fatty acid transport protein